MTDHDRRDDMIAGEAGASLIMVILFVTIFAVITGAILDFSSTGFKATTKIVDIRDEEQAIEGAIDGAINAIRGSETILDAGAADCFELPADPDGSHPEIIVNCREVGAGGVYDETPAWAILALGTASGEGINKGTNAEMIVAGSIFSHNGISITGGSKSSISVTGDAYARGTCDPVPPHTRFVVSGQAACGFGSTYPTTAVQARAQDPGFPAAISDIDGLPVDPAPTCVFGNAIVKFVPGVYTEHLSNLVPAGCASANTMWLSPSASSPTACPSSLGVYYFDFEENTPWDITTTTKRVIAGSLPTCVNGAPTAAPVWPSSDDVLPCDEDGPGVQLILGGTSRIIVRHGNSSQNGKLAICASEPDSAVTSQQIALYGLSSGARNALPSADLNSYVDRQPSDWTEPTAFADVPNAFEADGDVARMEWNGSGVVTPETLEVLFDNALLADVPAGSRINKAVVQVLHETAAPPGKSVEVGVKWRRSTGGDVVCTTPATGCDITSLVAPAGGRYNYKNFNDIAAIELTATPPALLPAVPEVCDEFDVCTPGTAAEQASILVDAMILRVNYTPPGFQAHVPVANTTCTSLTAILKSCNNPITLFSGTVYTPSARIAVSVHNKNSTSFARGAIARTFDLEVSASTKFEEAPFSLPVTTPSRQVLFTARVGSEARLRALVRFTDEKPAVSGSYPGYKAQVLSWAVLR